MQKYRKIVIKLYTLNLAILITHEIDSAFWKEWNLFGLPGGIQFFLFINFLLILFFLYGLETFINWNENAPLFSYALSLTGVFAFTIYTLFILLGHHEFTLPASLIILGGTLLASILQIFFTVRLRFIKNII